MRLAREVALIMVVTLVYGAPVLAGWRAMGFGPIPSQLTPDLYLHLVMSDIPRPESGVVLNPWYHVPAPESELIYLRFGGALQAFHLLSTALGGRLAAAVLVWTLLWTLLICLAARWLVSLLLEEPPFGLVTLSLGLLMLLDVGFIHWMVSQALHRTPATVPAFPTLPYLRPFFPQAAVPCLLLYVALQIRVLGESRWRYWLGMGVLQLLSLTAFPFATLLMAALTGLAMLFAAGRRLATVRWSHLAGFAVLCAPVDLLFVAWNAPALRLLTNHGALLRLDAIRARLILGYSVLVVISLTLIVAVAVRRRPPVRCTLTGLGLGTALLLLADGLVATSLQASHHVGYLVHTTVAILAIGLLGEAYARLESRGRRVVRAVTAAAATATFIYGCLAAYSTYRWYLPRNVARTDLVIALSSAAPDDLIVAPNDMLEDETSWLPLVSKAQVLFSGSAEFVLGSADAAENARRLALFLYLKGETADSVRVALWQQGVSPYQRLLVGFRRTQLLSSGERERTLVAVERELLPRLRDAEQRTPEVLRFLRQYRRIFVIDQAGDPFFRADRIGTVLRLEGERRLAEPWILRWGVPL